MMKKTTEKNKKLAGAKKRHKNADELRWHFPDLDYGEADGLADPLLQYFEGRHEWYIARETIQNSVDARHDQNKAVVVHFEKLNLPTKEVPGLEDLKERMKACFRQAQDDDEKTKSYFKNAIDILSRKSLSILKVSDFNTKGLEGADRDRSGRWYRLVSSVGFNRMTGVGGGSFGIGKGAPFAASAIRTVFYSTLNGAGEHIFQGKARLVTHNFEESERRGTGFFGINGHISVRDKSRIPKEFSRESRGTDVYILGYSSWNDDWRQELAKSILENFWMAIHDGNLVAKLVDEASELILDASTLADNLKKYSPEDAYFYYSAVIKPTRSEEKQLPILGSCRLYIRQDAAYPKDIALMRKPKMVVRKRKSRAMQDGYAGVFICEDDEGNKILRDTEPPEHDNWKPELHSDRVLAKKAVDELYDWIKETLREMANAGAGDPEDIPELDRFLPYEEEAETSNGNFNLRQSPDSFLEESPEQIGAKREETEEEVEDYIQQPRSAQRTAGSEPGSAGGSGKGEESGTEGRSGGAEEGEATTRINTSGIKFRTMAIKGEKGNIEYFLIIDPLIDQEGSINIVGVGDDANYPSPLDYAKEWESGKQYKIRSSFITGLVLRKGKREKIRLGLKSNKKYALGIESYEG